MREIGHVYNYTLSSKSYTSFSDFNTISEMYSLVIQLNLHGNI